MSGESGETTIKNHPWNGILRRGWHVCQNWSDTLVSRAPMKKIGVTNATREESSCKRERRREFKSRTPLEIQVSPRAMAPSLRRHIISCYNTPMKKRFDTSGIEDQLEILNSFDYSISNLTPFHIRINNTLDVWPSSRKAYDIKAHGHGSWRDGDLVGFVFDWFNQKSLSVSL